MKNKKLDTKFAGHHVSAGGFIFTGGLGLEPLMVILIKNKKGEYWIPKGHIEDKEDHVEASLREIEEEVGIRSDLLKYIDLCHIHKYSYSDQNGVVNTKEIYMNVFYVRNTVSLILEKGNADIVDGDWFNYEDALNKIIPYSRETLEGARELLLSKNYAE